LPALELLIAALFEIPDALQIVGRFEFHGRVGGRRYVAAAEHVALLAVADEADVLQRLNAVEAAHRCGGFLRGLGHRRGRQNQAAQRKL